MKSHSNKPGRIIALLALLIATACAPAEKTITIIAVNDVHGSIDNFPRLATLVEQYRATDSTRMLLIDAGDRWTGNPYVDLYAERGLPIIALENELGFDLATHGNHEFDFGLEVLAKRIGESRVPFVVANLDSNGSLMPQPSPYHCFDVDGVKICMLGLITTARGGYPDGFVENFGTIKFSHPISTALQYRSMRDSCDVMVGLTHIGYELDSVLAVEMPQLDLIIGGHSHTLVSDNTHVGRTLVTQAGSRLQYANVITLKMQGKKLAHIESKLVRLDTIAPNPRYTVLVEQYTSRPELLEVKGSLSINLDNAGVVQFAADIIRKAANTQLSLYNSGGIRVDSLPKGPMRVIDIYSMEPFGNRVVIMHMTADQIKEIILKKFNSTGKEAYHEDLYPSGFTYNIVTNSSGEATDVTLKITAKPGANGTYTVALSDYVSKTYDFSAQGTGIPTGMIIAPLIEDYFTKNSPVKGDNTSRISIGK